MHADCTAKQKDLQLGPRIMQVCYSAPNTCAAALVPRVVVGIDASV